MSYTQLNVRIAEVEHEYLEQLASQTVGILTKAGVVRLLVQHAMATGWSPLDKAATPLIMAEAAPRRGSSILTSSNTYKQEVSKCLEEHGELIREFWRIKKGSRGDTAWKLLMTELTKLKEKHGDAVVKEQLQLAINGKWAGISLARYEQFKQPVGGRASDPLDVPKHPASRLFQNGRFVDEDGPTTNPALQGLF